jgi:hypothetical protein
LSVTPCSPTSNSWTSSSKTPSSWNACSRTRSAFAATSLNPLKSRMTIQFHGCH